MHDPSSGAFALRTFVTANGATPTTSGTNPADCSAPVMPSTWSILAATIITDLSPDSVSPRICLSQTISSIGKGMFCSTS